MELTVIVMSFALAQYIYFGIRVGGARSRTGIKAPAMSGNEEFECTFRVHQNTLELLIAFLPSLWAFSHYISGLWGPIIGAVYIVGRFVFSSAYIKDPSSRTLGFVMSMLPILVLMIGAVVGAVMSLMR